MSQVSAPFLPGYKHHQCVILSWDQAYRSGLAIFVDGSLKEYGQATNHVQRRTAVERAQQLEQESGLPLVVITEGHSHMPASMGANTATILGLGAARGRILECCEMLGHPSRRTLEIDVPDWRLRILGAASKKWRRSMVKRLAVAAAKQHCGVMSTDDEAEAICIGLAGMHHPAVEAVVGKRFVGVSWEPKLAKWRR